MKVKTYRSLKYIGKDLSAGPLPALFYFSLSAEDSLGQDPFNQPVVALQDLPIRIFSATIPGHENEMPATEAIAYWESKMKSGDDLLRPFFDEVVQDIESVKENCSSLGVAGLSRGVFVAAHVAARIPEIKTMLGFAPMTRLLFAEKYNLENLVPQLSDKTIRFYIGNRDIRVGTGHCADLIQKLAEDAYEKRISTSPIELFIIPSIGFQGHGTSPETFKAGATWIKDQLI